MKWNALVMLAGLATLTACQGCKDDAVEKARGQINLTNRDNLEFGGDPMPSEADQQAISQTLSDIAETSNSKDWDAHLDFYHPAVFKTEDAREGWKKMAHRYDSIGWYTEYLTLDVRSISPYVPYQGGQACILNANMKQRIYFGEQYTGIKEQYLRQMEDRYGINASVTYDEEKEEYLIDGKEYFYVFNPDTLDRFYMLQGKSLSEPEIAGLFSPADMQRLLSYQD